MSRKKFTAALATLIVAGTAIVSSSVPAQAATCQRLDGINRTAHYAATQDGNGACGTVGVQHGFGVSGLSSTIWTGWTYHSTIAATSAQPTIQGSHHSNSAG